MANGIVGTQSPLGIITPQQGQVAGQQSDLEAELVRLLSAQPAQPQPQDEGGFLAGLLEGLVGTLAGASRGYVQGMTGTDPGPNPIDELRSRRERRSEEERQRLEEERLRKLDAAQFALSRTDKSAELLRKEQEELRKIQREEEQITREEDAIKRQEKLEEKLLNARLESDQEIAELRRSTDMAIANLRNEGKGDRLREDMFRQNSTVLPDLLGAAQDQAALVREGKETRSAEELKEEYLLAVEGQLVGIDEDVKPFLKRAALHWERTVGKAIRAAEEERAKQEAERKRTSIPLTEREQARGGADPLLGVLRSVLETQGQSALNVPQRPPFIGKQ